MKKRSQILELLRILKPALEKEFKVQRLALFGSWARDEQNPTSDIDILVDVDPSIGLRFVTLAERLEVALDQRVDLVSRRSVTPSLWKQIESELIDV